MTGPTMKRLRVVSGLSAILSIVAVASAATAATYRAECGGPSPNFAVAPGQTVTVTNGASFGSPVVSTPKGNFTIIPGGSTAFVLGVGESAPISQPMTLKVAASGSSSGGQKCWVEIEVQ